MAASPSVKWSDDVESDDFDAGRAYLALLYPAARAQALTRALERAKVMRFAAKDIVRASELALLSAKDSGVVKQRKKIAKGQRLSPLLLVRESGHARLIVADGFHRLCAVHALNPDEPVACKLA